MKSFKIYYQHNINIIARTNAYTSKDAWCCANKYVYYK